MDLKFVGFNFKKISIEKKKDVSKEIKINTNVEINEVKEQNSDLFKEGNLFYFEYEFKVNYEPEYANILFTGGILALIKDEKFIKEIKEQWKAKKIPEDLRIILMNSIFSKCNLRALQLEEDLNLPPHLPMPKVSQNKKL